MRVLVGVDGSAPSVRALVWALELADSFDAEIVVLTVWPLRSPVLIGEVPGHFNDARWQAVHAQRQSLAHARQRVTTQREVQTHFANASVEDALAAASHGADLVVLGAGGGTGRELGAAVQLVASCPVVQVASDGSVAVPLGELAFGARPR